jgi:hypothetical protein
MANPEGTIDQKPIHGSNEKQRKFLAAAATARKGLAGRFAPLRAATAAARFGR